MTTVAQIIIDESTPRVIAGTYQWDRDNAGVLVPPSGSTFPGSPTAKELFWRTDEVKLYRRNDANDAWELVKATPDTHTHTESDITDLEHYDSSDFASDHAGLGGTCPQAPQSHTHSESDITDLDHDDTDAIHGNVASEFSSITEESSPGNDDLFVMERNSDGAKRTVRSSNLPGGSGGGQSIKHEMHKITSGESTSGYFTLSSSPVNAQSVRARAVGGPTQVGKQVIGATGATPDFDVLSTNQLHFNNNGAATGLSGDLETDDIVVIEYQT